MKSYALSSSDDCEASEKNTLIFTDEYIIFCLTKTSYVCVQLHNVKKVHIHNKCVNDHMRDEDCVTR